MRRPRFTIRALLILVALCAIGMWGWLGWWPRYRECSSLARFYTRNEANQRNGATAFRGLLQETRAQLEDVKRGRDRIAARGNIQALARQDYWETWWINHESDLLARIAKSEREADWYRRRKEQCQRAALLPWLATPLLEFPDEPEIPPPPSPPLPPG
jgi:hypothetical protein